MLDSELWTWVPARIKQHKERFDVVTRGNFQKLSDSLFEALRIFLPYQVVQKDAHRVHSHVFRPTEFLVDLSGIETLRLPHLQLVDRIGRDVITPHKPWLLVVPGFCFVDAPRRCLRQQRGPARSPGSSKEPRVQRIHEEDARGMGEEERDSDEVRR